MFWRADEQNAADCGSGWAFVHKGKRILKTPKLRPPVTRFQTCWMRAMVEEFIGQNVDPSFEVFLHRYAIRERQSVIVADVRPFGWNR